MSSRGVDKGATVLSYISSLEYRTISFSSSFRKIRFQLFSSLLKLKQNQSKWKLNKEIELTYSLLTFHCTFHFSQSSPVQSSPHYTTLISIPYLISIQSIDSEYPTRNDSNWNNWNVQTSSRLTLNCQSQSIEFVNQISQPASQSHWNYN